MSGGERAILRMSKEIAQLKDALILIDEVEAGLHPYAQKIFILELQQLALRNNLQVILTSHSQVVIDSVAPEGRILLDRDELTGKVTVRSAYDDVVQNALYGGTNSVLNLLCEDDASEGIILGILDVICVQENIRRETFQVTRDTGADEFPSHASTLKKFSDIQNFIFILDGDQRDRNVEGKIQKRGGSEAIVLYLPGNESPEIWVWDRLRKHREEASQKLYITSSELIEQMNRLDDMYDTASDSLSVIIKTKLQGLSEALSRRTQDICRSVAELEARKSGSDIETFVE